jgi:hypothetical protein
MFNKLYFQEVLLVSIHFYYIKSDSDKKLYTLEALTVV